MESQHKYLDYLVGRKIISVKGEVLLLDNEERVKIVPNESYNEYGLEGVSGVVVEILPPNNANCSRITPKIKAGFDAGTEQNF